MVEVGQVKSIPCLEGLSPEALGGLADILQKRTYAAGDPIFNENTEGGDLYLLGRGTVKISRRAKEGGMQALGTVKEGDFFGIMTFLAGGRHSANAQAGTECVVYTTDRRSFEAFTERFPSDAVRLHRVFLNELIRTVRTMNDRYIDMVNYMWRWR